MHYAICPLSVVPIRTSPSHKSEMASQLLFGELLEILETKGRLWSKIRCAQDNFVGWVESNQISALTPSEYQDFSKDFAFSLELVQGAMGFKHFVPITIGARLPNFDGIHFQLGETKFTFSGQAVLNNEIKPSPAFVIKIAKRYLNTPFLWGGRSPFGIDSAGLVQVVYGMCGIQLPRDPVAQIESGVSVDFVEQARPGDLAFFENKNGRISHVGIIMEEKQIIHAFGGVRIDKIDHFGIYNEDQKRYTHKLRLCKRMLPKEDLEVSSNNEEVKAVHKQVSLFK